MQIKTISATYGRKWNLDDYESATVELTIWADLEPADDPADCERELFAEAKARVRAESAPMLAARVQRRQALAGQVLASLPRELQEIAKNIVQIGFPDEVASPVIDGNGGNGNH